MTYARSVGDAAGNFFVDDFICSISSMQMTSALLSGNLFNNADCVNKMDASESASMNASRSAGKGGSSGK